MRIALVSDTHLSPRDTLLARNWAVLRRWVETIAADLTVHLGDITADGAADAAELAHARGLICDSGRDFLFLPGNHDIGDAPIAETMPSPPLSGWERLSSYRRIFGPDWWSFHVEDWQILGLNAQLLGSRTHEEAAQQAWLEETLQATEGPLGVMIHKPLWAAGSRRAPGRYPPEEARRHLLSLLRKRDLRFIASGHTHQALCVRQDGTEHFWVPSTAFCIPDAMQEQIGRKCVGAAILDIQGERHNFTFAAPEGLIRHNLLDLDHIYPEVAQRRADLGPAAAL